MELAPVKSWLQRRARAEVVFNWSMALGAGVIGAVLAAGTAAIGTWLLVQCLRTLLALLSNAGGREFAPDLSRPIFLVLSALVLAGLFFANRHRDDESIFSFCGLDRKGNVWTGDASLLLGTAFTGLVCSGPILVHAGIKSFREGRRWQRMNLQICAQVIVLLLTHPRRVGLRQIARDVPGFERNTILPQLLAITGIVHLRTTPEGLSISSSLREEITGSPQRPKARPTGHRFGRVTFACAGCGQRLRFPAFLAGNDLRCPNCGTIHQTWRDVAGEVHIGREKERRRAHPKPEPAAESPALDHEILGVAPGATLYEIKRAYRKLMKEHHPDRMSTSDSAERSLAEEKTKAINRAYESLKQSHR